MGDVARSSSLSVGNVDVNQLDVGEVEAHVVDADSIDASAVHAAPVDATRVDASPIEVDAIHNTAAAAAPAEIAADETGAVDVTPVATARPVEVTTTAAEAPSWRLAERMKELELFYDVAALLRDDVAPVEDVIDRLAKRLPQAFRYPDAAVARIMMEPPEGPLGAPEGPFGAPEGVPGDGPLLRAERRLHQGGHVVLEVTYPSSADAASARAFLPEEDRLLAAVTDLVAGWLDRRRAALAAACMRADLERRTDVQHTLLEAYGRLLGSAGVGVADLVLDAALRLVPGARHGTVLVRTDRGTYRYAAVRGYDAAALAKIELPADVVLFGRDWRSGEPFVVDDLESENRAFSERHPELATLAQISLDSGMSESFITPVVVDGALVAAIDIERRGDCEPVGPDMADALRLYAQNIGAKLLRAEHEMQADLLAAAVAGTSNGVAIVDVPRRGGEPVFRVVNPALADLLGRDVHDLTAWNVVGILSPEHLAMVARAITTTVHTGAPNRFQANLERSDGTSVWVEVAVSVLHQDPDCVRVLATLRDVTTLRTQVVELERLAADLQLRLDEARTLEAIDAAVAAGGERGATLRRMVEVVARQPGVARATLYPFDVNRGHLESTVTAPPSGTVRKASAGALHVLREQTPLSAAHATEWADGPEEGAYRAWPLVCNDALVGVLEVTLAPAFVPDAGWSRFQNVVCGQLAIAVDNAGMVDRLRHAAAAYADLAEFSGRIEEIDDADELVDHGVRALMGAFGMTGAAYFTQVETGFDVTATWGVLSDPTRPPLRGVRFGEGAVGRAAHTRESVYVESYQAWPHRLTDRANDDTATVLALPVHSHDEVAHVIMISASGRPVPLRPDQVTIARAFVRRLERALERTHTQRQVEASREEAFRALGLALEYRDFETRGHTDRVVALARRFAQHLGLPETSVEALAWGAYLHDLGKLAIPDGILLKPARPTSAEFEWAKRHAVIGHEMSRDLVFLPEASREVVRSHHERWDGGGYPDGLAGDDIPFLARVFALVDVYDALVSERAYKPAWSVEAARAEIAAKSGTQFDPELGAALLAMLASDPAS